MKDKIFIDTNIFVYAFLDTDDSSQHAKHLKAVEFLKQFDADSQVIISTQALSEYYSALLKNKISDEDIQESAKQLVNSIEVVSVSKNIVMDSYSIKNKYRYSYWDSLIISSALQSNCTVLYSEDLQHNQKIEKQLSIINPFTIIQ
jgi:predicted nucleic acid-binding protein